MGNVRVRCQLVSSQRNKLNIGDTAIFTLKAGSDIGIHTEKVMGSMQGLNNNYVEILINGWVYNIPIENIVSFIEINKMFRNEGK